MNIDFVDGLQIIKENVLVLVNKFVPVLMGPLQNQKCIYMYINIIVRNNHVQHAQCTC